MSQDDHLNDGERELRDRYNELGPLTQLVVLPTFAPQVVPPNAAAEAGLPVPPTATQIQNVAQSPGMSVPCIPQAHFLMRLPPVGRRFGADITAHATNGQAREAPAIVTRKCSPIQIINMFLNATLRIDHLVAVTISYDEVQAPKAHARVPTRALQVVKKTNFTKTTLIDLRVISRVDFVISFFKVHDMDDKYAPSKDKGPAFKMWWQGTGYVSDYSLKLIILIHCRSGGKSGAATVETDNDFRVLIETLKRKNTKPTVNILIDLDECSAFLRRKRVSFIACFIYTLSLINLKVLALEDAEQGPSNGQDSGAELMRGTKVYFIF